MAIFFIIIFSVFSDKIYLKEETIIKIKDELNKLSKIYSRNCILFNSTSSYIPTPKRYYIINNKIQLRKSSTYSCLNIKEINQRDLITLKLRKEFESILNDIHKDSRWINWCYDHNINELEAWIELVNFPKIIEIEKKIFSILLFILILYLIRKINKNFSNLLLLIITLLSILLYLIILDDPNEFYGYLKECN